MLMKCTDISAALHACAHMEQEQQHPWQWWMDSSLQLQACLVDHVQTSHGVELKAVQICAYAERESLHARLAEPRNNQVTRPGLQIHLPPHVNHSAVFSLLMPSVKKARL